MPNKAAPRSNGFDESSPAIDLVLVVVGVTETVSTEIAADVVGLLPVAVASSSAVVVPPGAVDAALGFVVFTLVVDVSESRSWLDVGRGREDEDDTTFGR